MGFATSTPMFNMLNILGIGIGVGETILQQAKLYRTGSYNYTQIQYGAVYDTLRYNSYLSTYINQQTGVFTGGYLDDGTTDWVASPLVQLDPNQYVTIENTALETYNAAASEYLNYPELFMQPCVRMILSTTALQSLRASHFGGEFPKKGRLLPHRDAGLVCDCQGSLNIVIPIADAGCGYFPTSRRILSGTGSCCTA